MSPEPYVAPTDHDMVPSERREFVRTHRTCIFGYGRQHDGPAMSVVYYIPTDDDELLVSTMAARSKARAVARDPKVSLCILDEQWPFAYLQVYAEAAVSTDRDLVIDVMMAVAGRMSGQPLSDDAGRSSHPWPNKRTASWFAAGRTRPSHSLHATCIATTRTRRSLTGSPRRSRGTPRIPPRLGRTPPSDRTPLRGSSSSATRPWPAL